MKSKLRKLADGGSPNPSMLGTGAAARAGGLLAGRGRQIDDAVDAAAGAPAPAPQQVAQAPKKSGLRSMLGLADGGSYLDDGYNANRYQQSQLKNGGRVKGPGGRTDDKVGPVMLSDEEYVLPGDTADAIGRDKLDAIRLATHEFKDERKESALRGRADGGDGWYDDMMPMDHLADGGNPWIVDSKGTVRPNSFGDAAAGPGYQQPRLPPPQPGTATPAVTRAVTRAEKLGRMAGSAARVGLGVGGGLAATAPLAGFGDYKADTGGVDNSAPGMLRYLAKGEFGNAGTSLSGGLGEALADSGRGVAKTVDSIAGLVGANPDLTGKYDGMIKDKFGGYLSLRNPEVAGPPTSAASPAGPSPVQADEPALRSDQNAELPVQPGSYQSRRLSQMGVPKDVQNSSPLSGDLSGPKTGGFSPVTQGRLATQGTDQYQNLGTYGGNGNIYGKADDPSRPGRINNFVGAGSGYANEASGSGFSGGATGALQSALRGYGGETAQPAPQPTQPVANQRSAAVDAINARYDQLLKGGRGKAVEFGSDWSQRHGIALEKARGDELSSVLNNENTNATSRANAQLSSETSMRNADVGARTNMLEALSRMETARGSLTQQAQAAQLKVLQDAQKYADDRQDKGEAATNDWIKRRFTSNGLLGKEQFDSDGAAKFTDFLGSGKAMVGPPKNRRPLMSLPPQERLAALPDVYQDWSVNEAINSGGGLIGGGRTTNSPGGLVSRPANIADLANGLPLSEYLGAKVVPGYASNVVERSTDRKVRSVEAIAGDDLERKKAIMRNAGKE